MNVLDEALRMESTCAACGQKAQVVELVPPGESNAGDALQESGSLAPFARFLRGEGGTLVTTGVNGEAAFPLPAERASVVRIAIERTRLVGAVRHQPGVGSELVPGVRLALLQCPLAPDCRFRRRALRLHLGRLPEGAPEEAR